jgi:hypothetical protein
MPVFDVEPPGNDLVTVFRLAEGGIEAGACPNP